MAAKNSYRVSVVVHNDKEGAPSPISYTAVIVLARSPNQATSKVIKSLGDTLIFIECIELIASNDPVILGVNGSNVCMLVG
jgi:hypothetical protein